MTFADYADEWMAQRELKERTRDHYRKLLDNYLIPAFGTLPLASDHPDDVRRWYARFDATKPAMRAHCYGLLRTIYSTAASDGKVAAQSVRSARRWDGKTGPSDSTGHTR